MTLRQTAIPVTVHGWNSGKTIISKYKGVIYDLENTNFLPTLLKNPSFCVVADYEENPAFPNNGKKKNICYKTLI